MIQIKNRILLFNRLMSKHRLVSNPIAAIKNNCTEIAGLLVGGLVNLGYMQASVINWNCFKTPCSGFKYIFFWCIDWVVC